MEWRKCSKTAVLTVDNGINVLKHQNVHVSGAVCALIIVGKKTKQQKKTKKGKIKEARVTFIE